MDAKKHIHPRVESGGKSGFDCFMFSIAVILLTAATTAVSILITLPEALEAAATPALGAPWITAAPPALAVPKPDAAPRAEGEFSARLP